MDKNKEKYKEYMEGMQQEDGIYNERRMQQSVSEKKTNGKRKTLIGCIIAVFLIGAVMGISYVGKQVSHAWKVAENKAKYQNEQYVRQDTLNYLEERYEDEFVIESVRGMSYAYDYVNMYAYPKGFEDEAHKFKVQGRYNEDGNLEYYDSYVMVKLTDDYEAYLDEIIDEYFDDYKFYLEFDSEWITSNLPPDTTVEDLWDLRANVDYPLPDLLIFLNSSQKENFVDLNVMNMSADMAKMGLRGSIHITCFEKEELFEEKNRENKREFSTYEANNSKWHVIFVQNENKIDYR